MNAITIGLLSGVGGAVVGASITYLYFRKQINAKVNEIVDSEIASFKETYHQEAAKEIMEQTTYEEEINSFSDVEQKSIEEYDPSIIRTDYGEPITRADFERAQLKYHDLVSETIEDDQNVKVTFKITEEEDPEGYVDPHDFDEPEEESNAPVGIEVYTFDEYLNTQIDESYPQILLTYHRQTGTIFTEDDELIEHQKRVVGSEALTRLVKNDLDGGDALYVVNHNRQTVYEIYVQET